MEFPFAGARLLARLSRRKGHEMGRRRTHAVEALEEAFAEAVLAPRHPAIDR
jgi:hypothetical protein